MVKVKDLAPGSYRLVLQRRTARTIKRRIARWTSTLRSNRSASVIPRAYYRALDPPTVIPRAFFAEGICFSREAQRRCILRSPRAGLAGFG